jgi:hypothetical protein
MMKAVHFLEQNRQHQAKQTVQQRVIALLEALLEAPRFLRLIQSPIQQQFRSDGRNGYGGLKTF